MEKKVIWLSFIILIGFAPKNCLAKYSGGDGSETNPYRISNAYDMNDIGLHDEDRASHFVLTNDIDLAQFTGTQFNIIGYTSTPFTGVFDGNGHTISNFTYTYSGSAQKNIGIFGYVDGAAAEIKNLTVANPDVNGGANGTDVGAIAGYLKNGTIRNCTVTGGSVRGTWLTGGLAGSSRGQIIDCHADTEVGGEIWSGGLVGSAWSGLIQNCGTSAAVHGIQNVGGLVGENGGQIIACFATGTIDANSKVGGLVGENTGSISQSYATGEVVAAKYDAGGFAGRNIGGTIYDCYANGKVYADDSAGGFASLNWGGTISNCYSTGYVDATYFIGGFLEHDIDGLTSDCFWDTQTSGLTISAGGTGKTTSEMKTAGTFTSAGWDFTTPVWRIEEGNDYPRMIWQPLRNKCLYVDPNATGTADGSSWQNAFHYLQDAFEAVAKAVDVNEVRVAAGIYRPDRSEDFPSGTGDRGASFKLIEGIRIKGGYAGFGKPDPNARDFELYQAILSGDLLVNDTAVTDACDLNDNPNRAENSYNVVSSMGISSSTVLDGFTITGGNANGTGDWSLMAGGGMFIKYGNPQIRNCTFVHNLASTSGAGMYIMASNCSISQCEFNSNFLPGANVQPCGGGALGVMWSDALAITTINSCRFIQNKSYEWGGAISNFWSNLEITDCVFSQNVTYDSHDIWSSPEGGGIFSMGGKLVLQNCLFSANAAIGESFFTAGGAMNFEYKCQPVLQNCTFVDNSSSFFGGGISGYSDMNTITLANCIFWNNTDKDGAVESTQIHGCNEIVIDYSCVQGWTGTLGGVGNIDADPCFARPGHWDTNDTPADANDDFWVEGDYHLKSHAGRWDPNTASWVTDTNTSPCIDAGDTNSDWTAELWPHGKRINMGAYGGTPQASMSLSNAGNIANLDNDISDVVDYNDLGIFLSKWCRQQVLLAEDLNRDGVVNSVDYGIFANNWLIGLQ